MPQTLKKEVRGVVKTTDIEGFCSQILDTIHMSGESRGGLDNIDIGTRILHDANKSRYPREVYHVQLAFARRHLGGNTYEAVLCGYDITHDSGEDGKFVSDSFRTDVYQEIIADLSGLDPSLVFNLSTNKDRLFVTKPSRNSAAA